MQKAVFCKSNKNLTDLVNMHAGPILPPILLLAQPRIGDMMSCPRGLEDTTQPYLVTRLSSSSLGRSYKKRGGNIIFYYLSRKKYKSGTSINSTYSPSTIEGIRMDETSPNSLSNTHSSNGSCSSSPTTFFWVRVNGYEFLRLSVWVACTN